MESIWHLQGENNTNRLKMFSMSDFKYLKIHLITHSLYMDLAAKTTFPVMVLQEDGVLQTTSVNAERCH